MRKPPENLEAIREALGFSKSEFAEKSGFSRHQISRWEQGTAVPHLSSLSRIADVLGVTIEQLTGDEDVDLDAIRRNFEAKATRIQEEGNKSVASKLTDDELMLEVARRYRREAIPLHEYLEKIENTDWIKFGKRLAALEPGEPFPDDMQISSSEAYMFPVIIEKSIGKYSPSNWGMGHNDQLPESPVDPYILLESSLVNRRFKLMDIGSPLSNLPHAVATKLLYLKYPTGENHQLLEQSRKSLLKTLEDWINRHKEEV